jgi:proteasome component ECM29
LSDIIVGKNWVDFGGGSSIVDEDDIMFEQIMPCECASVRIARLIRVTIRSLDDIRLTVREAGEVLSKSVKNLLVSLSDSSSLHGSAQISENASDALAAATSIPYLIKTGLNQSCVEAANFSISCLVGIVDVCRPKLIEPFIPSLIGALLMALSGIEPALLNNLQARAAGETLESEREVEQLRLRLADKSLLSSVITKVLNMVPQLDLESQRLVVFHLDKALRIAHGLTTRNAVTDAIISVATKCPDAFIMNASTSRLLNAIYSAIYQEKKDTLMRGKFSYAIGFIANLAPSKTVRSLALKACDSYLENFDSKCFCCRTNCT